MSPRRVLRALAVGAVAALAADRALRAAPPGGAARWTRRNHAGRPVTLLEGPAYAVGAVAGAVAGGAGAPAALTGLGAATFGALDDLAGDGSSKGLGGHLGSLRHGHITTGTVKILGLGATGLLVALLDDRRHHPCLGGHPDALATLLGGAVVAGSANMANLLDLRPGRALKAVLLVAGPLTLGGPGVARATAAGAAGAALALLPPDLAGRAMLGDTGANAAGALLGAALAGRTGRRGRGAALVVLTALTLVSERVSFTRVIESTPVLRQLDALGRPRHQ